MCRIILLLFFFSISDGRFFRNDYTYYQEVGGWMKLHRVPAVWHEARLRCTLEGSVLSSPLNDELLKSMKTIMGYKVWNVFTGYSNVYTDGDFHSVEGVPLDDTTDIWAAGEPDNRNNSEHCLAMNADGRLSDASCEGPRPYICYKKNSQEMPSSQKCGTVDPEYSIDTRTNHCYKFHRAGQTWTRASMTCSAEGGYLSIINSALESLVLKEIFAKNPVASITSSSYKDLAFIGFHDWGERGSWMTVHGETLKQAGYEMWMKDQPNNGTHQITKTGQYCGALERSGTLNDMWCFLPAAFICEKAPGNLLDNTNGTTEEVEQE